MKDVGPATAEQIRTELCECCDTKRLPKDLNSENYDLEIKKGIAVNTPPECSSNCSSVKKHIGRVNASQSWDNAWKTEVYLPYGFP